MTSINFAGIGLSVLFLIHIISKRNKDIRDYLLGFFILLLGTYLLIKFIFENELYSSYPIIIYLDIYYWVLLGPTLLIYTITSIRRESKLRFIYLSALIPALTVTVLFSDYLFVNPLDFVKNYESYDTGIIIGHFIWLYNSLIFYIISIVYLKKHRKRIKHRYSYTKSIDLKWLYYLTHGFAVFIFYLVLKSTIKFVFNWSIPIDNYNISVWVVIIYIFGIGYFGYKQRNIFGDDKVDEVSGIKNQLNVFNKVKTAGTYEKSGLNNKEAQLLLIQLKEYMKAEQPYLDCELSLPDLASKLNISTQKLSQVINKNLNMNFFDFINGYRIEKVKELLSDPEQDNYKIESLAYDSGFNSRSTFYNLFKKSVGVTPAEYRRKYRLKAG